jgi:hypothetical protein
MTSCRWTNSAPLKSSPAAPDACRPRTLCSRGIARPGRAVSTLGNLYRWCVPSAVGVKRSSRRPPLLEIRCCQRDARAQSARLTEQVKRGDFVSKRRSADLAHPANTRNAPEREHRSSAPERGAVAPVGLGTGRHLAHVAGPASGLQNDLSHGLGLHVAILRGNDDSAPPADEPDPRWSIRRNSPLRPTAATAVTWCPMSRKAHSGIGRMRQALAARTGIPIGPLV